MLDFVNVRGTFEGNEYSVLIGPMNYKPLVPWKPRGQREAESGWCEGPWWPKEMGLGPWMLGARDRRRRWRASAGKGGVNVEQRFWW